jgi:tetratricopeptide (TPR) repeat protein
MRLGQLRQILRQSGVLGEAGGEPTPTELADALWLAALRRANRPAQPTDYGPAAKEAPDAACSGGANEPVREYPPRQSPTPPEPEPDPAPPRDQPSPDESPSDSPVYVALPVRGEAPQGALVSAAARPQLPEALLLARAMRPLRRRTPSATRYVLDEEGTAELRAEQRLWLPALLPDSEPTYDLALVVDDSESMALWGEKIREFRLLCERVGAFRDVRSWRLGAMGDGRQAKPILRGIPSSSPPHYERELIDPSGRRIVLVITDGVHPWWRLDGPLRPVLARWALAGPLAIVQPFPQRLWDRSPLRPVTERFRPGWPGTGPTIRRTDVHNRHSNGHGSRESVAVPVLELSPSAMHRWAGIVAGTSGPTSLPAVTLPRESAVDYEPPSAAQASIETKFDPARLVRDFRAAASPAAYQLAGYLSAAPLTLPVMRLVQESMMPEAGPSELAEVFLSGLLRRSAAAGSSADPGSATYVFAAGIRDVLQSTLTKGEALSVLDQVGNYLIKGRRGGRSFSIALKAQSPEDDIVTAAERFPTSFGRISGMLLERIGGPYAEAVRQTARPNDGLQAQPLLDPATLSETDEVVLDFCPEDQLWAEWITDVLSDSRIVVRWGGDVTSPSAGHQDGRRTVTIVTPAYQRQTQDFTHSRVPDLAICVPDQADLPYRLADVPVIFLKGLTGHEAARRLLDRLGGQRLPGSPPIEATYPGSRRTQIARTPTRNPNFTGREKDLRNLRDELQAEHRAEILALLGLGGVGKTQMALEYCHRFRADYDIIWWLNCGQSQYVDVALTDLGRQMREVLGAQVPEEGSVAEVAQQVLQQLSSERDGRRWLLIYDNADDTQTIKRLLPSGRGHVLITSRDGNWEAEGRALPVNVFTEEESVRHLRLRLPRISDEDAKEIAELLGNLPLAIASAGALLAETGIPVTAYIEELKQEAPRTFTDRQLADYPEPVARAWDLSLDRLQEVSPAAARLFGICAMMAPDISLNLVYSNAMAAVLAPLDPALSEPMIIGRLVRQIDRLALVKLDVNAHQIQVHRLVQAAVRGRMPEEERETARQDVHQLLVAARPQGEVDVPAEWPTYRSIWPHIRPSGAMLSPQAPVRQLLIDRVRYLRLRGDLERGRRRAREIEAAWEEMLARADGDAELSESIRRQLLRLRFNLANILRDLGDFKESRAIDQNVLERQRELLGDAHPHTLMTLGGLAADLRALGQYAEALRLDLDTYEAWEQGYGEEYQGTLGAAHNLAVSYRFNGDFRSALAFDQTTLERRLLVHGPGDPRTIHSGCAVVRDLLEGGRYAEAVPQMVNVVGQAQAALGDDDRTTLNARMLLGVATRRNGDPHAAEAEISAARLGLARGFGPDSMETLAARLSEANNSLMLRRVAEARAAMEGVLAVYQSRLGAHHPYYLICRIDIAAALYLQNDYESALLNARIAADELDRNLGSRHPYTLAARMAVAAALAGDGRLPEAANLQSEIASAIDAVLGPNHPDTLRCQANTALTERDMGAVGASNRLEASIRNLTDQLGIDHPDIDSLKAGKRLLQVIDPQPF